MYFDFVALGGGIIGFTFIENLINNFFKQHNLKNTTNRVFNFAIIDLDLENFPGGVAYGFKNSLHGYFNNPLRLAPLEFINFLKTNKEIKKKIIDHLNINGRNTDKKWIKENKKILFNPNSNQFLELYLPRIAFAFWLNYKFDIICDRINKLSKKNLKINLYFLKGEANDIIKINKNIKKIISNSNLFTFYTYNNKTKKNLFDRPSFFKTNKKLKNIISLNTSLGIGIPPPKVHGNKSLIKNVNYLWDFYSEGSTNNLIERIYKFNKKIINIYFIGFKAGLLEALPELYQIVLKSKNNIKINCISPTLKSLQKAKLSNKTYSLQKFKQSNIQNYDTALKIYNGIIDEFEIGIKKNFYKYDVWTAILKKQILKKAIKNLNSSEIKKYNLIYFNKIRSLTRYTYSKPIEIKDIMIKKKYLNVIETKVKKITENKSKFDILTNKGIFKADIIINVSGPSNIAQKDCNISLIKNLKKRDIVYDKSGISVSKNFNLKKYPNLYSTGMISSGFNKERKTIIDAIISNSIVASNKIYLNLINKKNLSNLKISKIIFANNYEFINQKNVLRFGGLTLPNIFNKKDNFNLLFNKEQIKKINNHSIKKTPLRMIFDGKAGSGKSTIANLFSIYFNIISLDTGYILKYVAKEIYQLNYSTKELNNGYIKNIFSNLTLEKLIDKNLDKKIYRNTLTKIAKNSKVRDELNKKILEFSKLFNSFIFTGRDTGSSVFSKEKEVIKIFLKVNDRIAANRKNKIKSLKMTSSDTVKRNINDKKNIIIDKNAIIVDNNHNNQYKTFTEILKYI